MVCPDISVKTAIGLIIPGQKIIQLIKNRKTGKNSARAQTSNLEVRII
jgi:hypothetical protein